MEATDPHPFWEPELEEWVEAKDLVVGSQVETDEGERLTVTSIATWTGFERSYNLTIADYHTYFVTQSDIWVHNSNPLPCDPEDEAEYLTNPGKYAGDSIPARGPGRDWTKEEIDAVNKIGYDTGCHSCGTTNPGTRLGNFIKDHMPVSKLNDANDPQRLYPQCQRCSNKQGGYARGIFNKK